MTSQNAGNKNGKHGSPQYSLGRIFLLGGIFFTISFCIISAVSTYNIIKAERTLEAHSRLENEIFFPLTRAIEEIYNSLADIQTRFTSRENSFTAQQFKWNMESAMDNLTQAEEAIKHLLTRNTDIITAVSETRRAAIMFQRSGIRALEQTSRLYRAMERCNSKVTEIADWASKFLLDVDKVQGADAGQLTPEMKHQAMDSLTSIRIVYLKICALFYRQVITFHDIRPDSNCEELWQDLFAKIRQFSKQYPMLAGRIMFMQEELKTLKKNMQTVLDASIAATASIERANSLADELGINLELCRQAIASTNLMIQDETRKIRTTMALSLAGAILLYILAALVTAWWLKKNILAPLGTFHTAIEKISQGNGDIQVQLPALKELSSIAHRFNIMTQRLREREQKLDEARQKWETTFRAIGGPAMVLDPEFRIVEYNQRLAELALDSQGELKGRKCYELICSGRCNCPVKDKEWLNVGNIYSVEKEIGGKPHLITISPIKDSQGRLESIVIVGADLSPQKKLEEKLRRAQKMEALGTLAGGVAHDLNNILAGIVTYPDIMLMQLPEDSPYRKALLTIRKSGMKATAVVQDLLTLARRGVENRKVLNLNDIITDYLESPELKKLLENAPDVEIIPKLCDKIMNIEGSPVHLSKTVMNLVTNAVEAMPNGGAITITTENTYLDSPIPGYDQVQEGDYVLLTVTDNGMGISAADLPHIFEPFYTRKVMGRSGSGLGMAVVWGTVQDHSGYIDIESEPGQGTTIKIYIPVTSREEHRETSKPSISELRGSESILVVDDVEEQREVAKYLLETLGYRVDTASSGEEALEKARKKQYDLVLLDMIMAPGMDGLDTYSRLSEMYPGQKAVIASGFSETERVRKAQELGAGAYIRKPYTMETLARAVRNELDRAKG